MVARFEVWLVSLDPMGVEMKKTRPCVVVSPNEMNQREWLVIIAPLTSSRRTYPTRIACQFQGKAGDIALENLRSIDTQRLVKKLGNLTTEDAMAVSARLQELFAW